MSVTHLPKTQDIRETQFSLEANQEPAEAEVQVTRVLGHCKMDTHTHTRLAEVQVASNIRLE